MLLEQFKRFTHGLMPAKPTTPQNRVRVLDQGQFGPFGLVLDAQGMGRVCWEHDGHIWSLAVGQYVNPRLAPKSHGDGRSPCMAMSPAGKGLLVWLTDADGITEINALGLGRRAGEPQRVFSTTGRIHHLQLTVDQVGNGLLVWLHELHNQWRVLALSFQERGQAWASESVVLGPACQSAKPCLAANAAGQGMALWEVESGDGIHLVVSHYEPSLGIWSERPSPVAKDGA